MSSSPDYSFVRRPVWLVGHLVALVAIVGFALLGMWQLSRHEDRMRLDRSLEERLDAPPISLGDLLASVPALAAAEYRPVAIEGTYLTSDEVILQARSLDGRSGHEVLTPLLLADGTAVIVDRGWVPIDAAGPPVVGAEPPAGSVAITGYARQSQTRSGFGPVDPAAGTLDRISRVDLDRLQAQIDVPLQPLWVQLAQQAPPQQDLPLVVDPPQPGGGPPHLSYAVQWFAFAAIVVVAYPILLYRTAQRGRRNESGRVPTSSPGDT